MVGQNEVWKDITGYEGLYQVSNIGNVKRLPATITALSRWGTLRQMKFEGKKINISHKSGSGYPIVTLSKNGKTKIFSIHRLVAIEFITNPKNLNQVNHKDGNKSNNSYQNLEWCTHSENMKHSFHVLNNKKINRKKVIDNNTGIIYESIMDAANELNIKYSTLARKLTGSLKNNTSLNYTT